MKNALISLVMMVALFGVTDTSQGQSYDTEYQAVQKLEDSCTSVEVFDEAHALWEGGRLVARNGDENGNEITREVPVTKIWIECEILDETVVRQILRLKHLRELDLQVGALGEVNFPVSRLKMLEKFSLCLDTEEDSDEFPVEFAREIGASQSIRWLDVPAAPALLSEVAKMTGLWSLRLGLTEEENVLPRLLPLKNTLRELDFWAPLESRTGEMLCEFTRLQSLRVWGTGSMQEKIDDFLSAIRPLPLRCLHLQFGNIGEEGADTLKGWDTLMEVQLPNGFPSERLAELERIERTVPLPGKDGRTRDVRRKVFFSNEKYMRTLNRPTCLDAHGEYIHWANPYSGVWMLGR